MSPSLFKKLFCIPELIKVLNCSSELPSVITVRSQNFAAQAIQKLPSCLGGGCWGCMKLVRILQTLMDGKKSILKMLR